MNDTSSRRTAIAARDANRSRRPSPALPRSSTSSPRTPARPPGPSELARRLGLPKSSIANICGALADAGLVRRDRDRASRWAASWPSSAARTSTSVDLVQEFYDACRMLPTGSEETVQLAVLDGTRDDVPRPPRRPPAGSAHLADRAATAGDALPRPARPRSRRSTRPTSSDGSTGVELPAADPSARSGPSTRCWRTCRSSARAATRWTTRRPSRASSASASMIPGRSPGEGRTRRASRCSRRGRPTSGCPLLIADLPPALGRLSDPLRADHWPTLIGTPALRGR